MSQYFLTAIDRISMRKKKYSYDFQLLKNDFKHVLDWWIDL